MRQAELRAGADYALPTYEPMNGRPHAARIRLLSVDGGGKATVKVLDPGPEPPPHAFGARSVKRNETLQVTTRRIVCPWNEWADHASEVEAQQDALASAYRQRREADKRERADRVAVDPDRPLPANYDEDRYHAPYPEQDATERDALINAYIKSRGLGPYASPDQIRPLLAHLPVPVLRDVLAANSHPHTGAAGTVASTFTRAAELLEMARIGALETGSEYGTRRPASIFSETDVAFVHAVQNRIAADGGELLMPPVPPLPEWVDEDEAAIAQTLGWLRVAVGPSSGDKLHATGCRSIHARPVLLCDHVPWWAVVLEADRSICGLCGGPAPRDLIAVAGFTAAADVWHARERSRIENWQQEAVQHLITVSAAARAQILEPDLTLGFRIVAALATEPPGDEGWHAYGLGAAARWHSPAKTADALPPAQREAARVLLHERLAVLESVIPESKRLPPLPADASVEQLREQYSRLKRSIGNRVPQIERLLFTLPNATFGV